MIKINFFSQHHTYSFSMSITYLLFSKSNNNKKKNLKQKKCFRFCRLHRLVYTYKSESWFQNNCSCKICIKYPFQNLTICSSYFFFQSFQSYYWQIIAMRSDNHQEFKSNVKLIVLFFLSEPFLSNWKAQWELYSPIFWFLTS